MAQQQPTAENLPGDAIAPPARPQALAADAIAAALQRDLAARTHLICLTHAGQEPPHGLLPALKTQAGAAQAALIEAPCPDGLLNAIANAFHVGPSPGTDPAQVDEAALRRRLVLHLSLIAQRRKSILLMVGHAERLDCEALQTLLHFFPPGYTTVVLAGPPALRQQLESCRSPRGPVVIDRHYTVGRSTQKPRGKRPLSVAPPPPPPTSTTAARPNKQLIVRPTPAPVTRALARQPTLSNVSPVTAQTLQLLATQRNLQRWRAGAAVSGIAWAIALALIFSLHDHPAEFALGRDAVAQVQPQPATRAEFAALESHASTPDATSEESAVAGAGTDELVLAPLPDLPPLARVTLGDATRQETPVAAPKEKPATRDKAPAAAKNKSGVSNSKLARLYLERAQYERRKGDLGGALLSVERGLASAPQHNGLLRLRTQLHRQARAQ